MPTNFVTLCHDDLKGSVIDMFNDVNDSNYPNQNLTEIFQETGDDKTILMCNPIDKLGVVFDKIKLSTLFTNKVDIRTFKDRRVIQSELMTRDRLEALNEKHGVNIEFKKFIPKPNSSYSKEIVDNFNLFCRATGFYELTLDDLIISMNDNVMTISVVQTNKFYTGSIEVTV